MTDAAPAAELVLPASVVSRVDVSRLVQEVERIDNELTSADIRAKSGGSQRAVPTLSEALAAFVSDNHVSLDDGGERAALLKRLRLLKDRAPVIHMTFAVEADRESLGQLVAWLRREIHPHAVIDVGLQPALVAGVYLRTPNHVHDLSLRAALQGSRSKLIAELESLRVG